MIFQEPMTSLNPVFTVGDQITEAIAAHEPAPRAALRSPRHRRALPRAHPGRRRGGSTNTRTSSPAACASG